MASKALRLIDGPQGELPLTRKPKPNPVPGEVIFRQKTFLDSVRLAVNVSGLEEKEIYISLGIDAGHWTRMMKGEAHFPMQKCNEFCELVENNIPLEWWAHSRGMGLHMLATEAEKQMLKLQDELDRERMKNQVLLDALQGKR